MGYTDQIHLGKHDAGTFVPIIDQNLEAAFRQFCCQALNGLGNPAGFVQADRYDADVEGCNGIRPHNPLFIVVLFDRRRNNAGDADTIAAHMNSLGLAFTVQIAGTQRFAVLGPSWNT